MGRGERSQRVTLKDSDPVHDDEVSRLAREFNLMADALQERERRLVASERLAAVGQLVAQVTHEIRNPLSSVALNFELLQDEFTSSEGDAQTIIQSSGTDLERLSLTSASRRCRSLDRAFRSSLLFKVATAQGPGGEVKLVSATRFVCSSSPELATPMPFEMYRFMVNSQ